MAAIEVTDDDMMNLSLDELVPVVDKRPTPAPPKDKVEVKRHGVTVDMVNSVEIAKRSFSADQGYELFEYKTTGTKSRISAARAAPVPGHRMRRR